VRVRPYNSNSTIEPSDIRRIFVYRSAVASWYGPGFYGNRTACGQTFTSRLMGVAHRSLPCGYLVRVRYNGRMKTVPVVDRGPYIDGRDYDLTEALKNYLGFSGVDRIWVTA
jgi:rare lipoprotein A